MLQLHSRAAQDPGWQKDTASMESGKAEPKLATEYLG